jgi:hypothetical protein
MNTLIGDNESPELKEAKSYIDRLESELDSIESWATNLREPIINKLAKSLVKRMNAKLGSLIYDSYYELGVHNFFDYFTLQFQSLYIDEIVPNLTDVFEDWIDVERERLSQNEKFILYCSTIMEQINNEAIDALLYKEVMDKLVELTNKHYETQRIQKIADKI